jgi:hypothetical protein
MVCVYKIGAKSPPPPGRYLGFLHSALMTQINAKMCWRYRNGRWLQLGYLAGPHIPGSVLPDPEGDLTYSHDENVAGELVAVYVPIRDQAWSQAHQWGQRRPRGAWWVRWGWLRLGAVDSLRDGPTPQRGSGLDVALHHARRPRLSRCRLAVEARGDPSRYPPAQSAQPVSSWTSPRPLQSPARGAKVPDPT